MRLAAFAFVLILMAPWAAAQNETRRLADALDLAGLARHISAEGHAMWGRFDAERLGGQGGPVWAAQVSQVYDPVRIETALIAGLAENVSKEDAETALVFLESDLGQRIVALDLQARAALQQADVLAAAEAQVGREGIGPQINRIIAAGRLIDRNVMLGLNWQMRFRQGLAYGGALGKTDQEIADDVLSGEAEVRKSLRSQLLAHLALSLSPLPHNELDAYATYTETPAGQAVNDGLFASVEALYDTLAYAMGQTAALFLPKEEL